jgi:hypothetical protein
MEMRRAWFLIAIAALVGLVVGLSLRGCHGRRPVTFTTPPGLAGLPTDSNDYTCAGTVPCATWAMPAPPAAGASVTDPVYSTTTWRLGVPADSSTGNVIPMYSRVQAFNSDDTLMFLADGVTTDLYDATVTPPRPIAQIKLSDGGTINGIDGDALWANTDPHRIYFNSPSGSPAGLQLRYVDVGPCVAGNCTLTPVVMHTFACATDDKSPLGPGAKGNKIETGSGGQGSMFDETDTFFSFSCDLLNGNGRNEIDLIRYNAKTDTVTQGKWYNLCPDQTPATCKVTQSLPKGANLFRMNQSADARYIAIIWQTSSSICPTAESKWTRSCGTEIFDDNYHFLGPASSYSAHQDMGRDSNGKPVFVSSSNSGTVRDYRALEVVDLTALDPTKVVAKHFLLPCTFSYVGAPGTCDSGTYIGYAKSWHISMTAWQQAPGWGLLSTFMLAGQSLGAPRLPAATTLGTAVTAGPGPVTVTPASMATIGPGVLSIIESGNANSESVTWSATTATTATAVFSKPHPATAAVQCLSCGNTGWGAAELIALKIDSGAADWSNFEFYRVARTQSIRDANYNCEAHATTNRKFTKIVWGASWNRDCDVNADVTGYYLSLAGQAPAPGAAACTLKMDATGTVIEDIHCVNLPVTGAVRGARSTTQGNRMPQN